MDAEEIRAVIEDLRNLRLDAYALMRSGNPAVREEGKRALVAINADIKELKRRLP